MSFASEVVEIGSDDAEQSHEHPDTSSHDHALALHDSNPWGLSWLRESFLQTTNNAERIAVGSPRFGVGILGLRLLEHYINVLPSMRSATDAVPVFDHSAAAMIPRFLGWRPKVATWPLSRQEAMKNRSFAV
ncbi:hypothetical protein CkaCkLH20_05045 [Colletotrichum karsti]|uniref:Uncharacterized protein n=1 Tax=Colletotrichum karsti TaxID=1095194 RepID=A0A9P6IER6_9PEZI|nr:uncharacterized protein CkaCkLH20_05045 [Colletotrichum karsti]KAF9877345.1 hypothetical protein CkaCkLH20_05045 [Colletotrichum karsti]